MTILAQIPTDPEGDYKVILPDKKDQPILINDDGLAILLRGCMGSPSSRGIKIFRIDEAGDEVDITEEY